MQYTPLNPVPCDHFVYYDERLDLDDHWMVFWYRTIMQEKQMKTKTAKQTVEQIANYPISKNDEND